MNYALAVLLGLSLVWPGHAVHAANTSAAAAAATKAAKTTTVTKAKPTTTKPKTSATKAKATTTKKAPGGSVKQPNPPGHACSWKGGVCMMKHVHNEVASSR